MGDAVRQNPIKATLAAGGSAVGAMVFEFFSPGLPQICLNAGAQFVLYDMEHTGLSFETLKTLLRASATADPRWVLAADRRPARPVHPGRMHNYFRDARRQLVVREEACFG